MSPLPDWLVERAALDEVPPASRERIDRADPAELAARITALRDDSAAELARHPARPAVAQIEERIALEARRRAERRRRRIAWLGIASSAAAIVVVARLVTGHTADAPVPGDDPQEDTRIKGSARLLAYRQVGDQVERLHEDALVKGGDVIQLRYNAGGHGYGVIASVDGAGVVTLHYPLREDAPPQATAVSPQTTTLPHAYALDDAPDFERFIFITANDPIDLQEALSALRVLAHRPDSATAPAELPAGLRQWSLRLRKPSTHESP